MKRSEFEDSIVGDLKVLWLDADEVRGIIRKTFAFADNKTRGDFETVGLMRELQKELHGPEPDDELRRLESKVDRIVERKTRRNSHER